MEIQVAKRTNFNAIYLSISDDKRGLVHRTLEEKGLMEIMDKILINGSLKNLARLMECGIRFQINLTWWRFLLFFFGYVIIWELIGDCIDLTNEDEKDVLMLCSLGRFVKS